MIGLPTGYEACQGIKACAAARTMPFCKSTAGEYCREAQWGAAVQTWCSTHKLQACSDADKQQDHAYRARIGESGREVFQDRRGKYPAPNIGVGLPPAAAQIVADSHCCQSYPACVNHGAKYRASYPTVRIASPGPRKSRAGQSVRQASRGNGGKTT